MLKQLFSISGAKSATSTMLCNMLQNDDCEAVIYEYRPPLSGSLDAFDALLSLLGKRYADGAVIKFSVLGHPVDAALLPGWADNKTTEHPVLRHAIDSLRTLCSGNDEWYTKTAVSPKKFRYFVSFHIPRGAEAPRLNVTAPLCRLSIDGKLAKVDAADMKRLVLGETVNGSKQVSCGSTTACINERHLATIHAKKLPSSLFAGNGENLTGAVGVLAEDLQMSSPFLMTIAVKYHAAEAHEVSVSASIIGATDKEALAGCLRVRRIWEEKSFVVQDTKNPLAGFLGSLPGAIGFGEPVAGATLRDVPFLVSHEAEFTGFGTPSAIFSTRKGEMAGFGCWLENGSPVNVLVAGNTGSGVATVTKHLLTSHLAEGCFVRIIDLEKAYADLARKLGGRVVDINDCSTADNSPCLNPFTHATADDLPFISKALLQAAISMVQQGSAEEYDALCAAFGDAVVKAWAAKGSSAGFDDVIDNLQGLLASGVSRDTHLYLAARSLFRSGERFGHFFNGPCSDFSQDQLVVFNFGYNTHQEVGGLFGACLYLATRKAKPDTRQLTIITDTWWFVEQGKRGHHAGFPLVADLFERTYARARRSGDAVVIASSSLLDLQFLKKAGTVIRENTAAYFLLAATDYRRAASEGLLDLSPQEALLLASVETRRPRFNEMYVVSPFGKGVIRLMLDSYTQHLFTFFETLAIDFTALSPDAADEALSTMACSEMTSAA